MKKAFNILLMCVMAVLTAMAQEAKVKSFEADLTDLTAAKYSRLDKNGVKCAVVKVQVLANNVQFQGGIIEPVEKKPGEYWVYMPQNEQRVRILSDDFFPLMAEFGEPLQASTTYIMRIESPQKGSTSQQKPKMSFLVLKVSPATANVKVDGVSVPVTDGFVRKALPNGSHTYDIEALGYAPEHGSVELTGRREERTILLRSIKPTLSITTTTEGTEIYINDELKGTDSWSGELYPDSYVVEGRKQGYRSASETVILAEGKAHNIKLPALAMITGSLSVDYLPVGADIAVDGKHVGISPDIIEDVMAGKHKVTVSADKYDTAEINVTVTEGETVSISGTLNESLVYEEGEEKKYKSYYSNGKIGFKYNDEIVIPAKYDEVKSYNEGFARVKTGSKYGFIDRHGNMTVAAIYDQTKDFSEGLAAVRANGKWGFVDKNGKEVIATLYDAALSFQEGLACVKLNGKYGFIDKNGNMVIAAIYDNAHNFSEGIAAVSSNEKYGFIDRSGNMVIPAKYESVDDFAEGMAAVWINKKWGYIDKSGNLIIPAKYDVALPFISGKANVKINKEEYYIDKNGKWVAGKAEKDGK